MEDDQDDTEVKFFRAKHGLAGPPDKRMIEVINGAGEKKHQDPRFHELIASKDNIGLMRYI